MNCDKNAMLLYAVTDRTWLKDQTLLQQVESCLKGGATFVQLREKELDQETFLQEAYGIKALCSQYRVPFVINDNVEVALACDADGVHIGQGDMSVNHARDMLGPNKIIGVSVQTVEQAIFAEKNGADYLGVGAVFPTSTKLDADVVERGTLKAICEAVSVPVVAIGGIQRNRVLELSGTGIDGVAVVSGIFAQEDIEQATKELLALSKEMVKSCG